MNNRNLRKAFALGNVHGYIEIIVNSKSTEHEKIRARSDLEDEADLRGPKTRETLESIAKSNDLRGKAARDFLQDFYY